MNIIRIIKYADVLTLANLAAGFLSLLASITHLYSFAVGFLLAAVVFDALDGALARKTRQANAFGKELDSLSDLVSFGVAPAVFGFSLGLTSTFSLVILTLFVLCGALRLSRFNVTNVDGYEGVPITTNGIVFPLLYLLSLWYNFPTSWYIAVYALMMVLMIATFRVPKLR